MQTSLTRLTADDGTRLVVHIWLPEWLIDGSLLVAEGAVDIACEAQVALHDIAALVPIVHEAGGTFTTATGDNAVATAQAEGTASTLATNGTLHRSVITQLTPE